MKIRIKIIIACIAALCGSWSSQAQELSRANLERIEELFQIDSMEGYRMAVTVVVDISVAPTDGEALMILKLDFIKKLLEINEAIANDEVTPEGKKDAYRREYQHYEKAIALAYWLFHKTKDRAYFDYAASIVERNQSIMLRNNTNDLEEEHRKRYHHYTIEIKKYNDLIKVLSEDTLNTDLKKQQDKINRYYLIVDSLIREKGKNPEGDDPTPPAITTTFDTYKLQKALGDKEALVQYFQGNEALYIVAITKEGVAFLKNKKVGTIERLALGYIEAVQGGKLRQIDLAHELYKELFQPLEGFLGPSASLVIIPDGNLTALPFEAFSKTPYKGWGKNYKTIDYLLYSYQIAYHHSARLYLEEREAVPSPVATTSVLAFAPIFEDHERKLYDAAPAVAVKDAEYMQLKWLPSSKQLAVFTSQRLQAAAYIGSEAIYANFVHQEGYDIVHFSTHTIVNNELPMLSKIAFAPTYTDDTLTHNGFMSLEDIFKTDISADLVVLGSCQTGSGEPLKGEGLAGIAYGFAYAGVPSSIYSLWMVDDEATKELLIYFYKGLHRGYDTATALHLAKREYLQKSNHNLANPYYWAGFVFNGRANTYQFSKPNHWWALALLLMVLVGFWRFKSK